MLQLGNDRRGAVPGAGHISGENLRIRTSKKSPVFWKNANGPEGYSE
jgi:hypothetical protein